MKVWKEREKFESDELIQSVELAPEACWRGRSSNLRRWGVRVQGVESLICVSVDVIGQHREWSRGNPGIDAEVIKGVCTCPGDQHI